MTLNNSLKDTWQSDRRKYLIEGIRYTCQCGVCPPFGNRINFFLKEINQLTQQYGVPFIKEALQILRHKYSN